MAMRVALGWLCVPVPQRAASGSFFTAITELRIFTPPSLRSGGGQMRATANQGTAGLGARMTSSKSLLLRARRTHRAWLMP